MSGSEVKGRQGPVVIALDADTDLSPAAAPDLPDAADLPAPGGQAMRGALLLGGAAGGRVGGWFIGSCLSLLGFMAGLAAWNFVTGLLASHPVLGVIAALIAAIALISLLVLVLGEGLAIARLGRLDRLRQRAEVALASGDLTGARATAAALAGLYGRRPDLAWGARRFAEQADGVLDAETLLTMAERAYLEPLDQAARRKVEAAARQVAAVTALVPLALADVAVALLANVRMIRAIAEIYGGRSGFLGSLRLLRAVMVHLLATGAVAVGDDLIHSVAGGGLLSKLSRRFGEGVVNGALTARVGVAAIEVCRPLPFAALPRPRVTNLVTRGLKGLFGGARADGGNS